MTIRTLIDVALSERAILVEDGVPTRVLLPGRHVVWRWRTKLDVVRYDTRALVADLPDEHIALLGSDVRLVVVGDRERALVSRRGRPAKWLGTGVHVVWATERLGDAPAVDVQIVDTGPVTAEPLRDDVRVLVPASDYVEVTVPDGSVGLRFVDGAIDAVLGAGRHAAWTVRRKVAIVVIETRARALHVTGQEVMTKDKVSLRLNASAVIRVVDAKRVALTTVNVDEALYLALQLALRDAIATRTLEAVLADRDEIVTATIGVVRARGAAIGVDVDEIGIKDLILPGEMKVLMNRVIEAQKEAEANVILRREETNATRSLAQTAKVLADNPLLVRLKELEAYQGLAAKVGTLHVVMGEGGLGKLELKL
jgi:regulator of protease activity HflC (stomatin/prohibitin superfamily)